MNVTCFMIRKNGETEISLRRYVHKQASDASTICTGPNGYHDAALRVGYFRDKEVFEKVAYEDRPDDFYLSMLKSFSDRMRAEQSFPDSCEGCGVAFASLKQVEEQIFSDWVYADDAGNKYSLRKALAGAMWFEDWLPNNMYWDNFPGPYLHVQTPGGPWNIDSRASNCTLPQDRQHRCWVRHGEPPKITVDKSGLTCAAGAGSIIAGGYHGFLRDGVLIPC